MRDARAELGAVGALLVLLLDILFENGKRRTTCGYQTVGSMPKYRLPVELRDMGFMLPADSA